MTSGGAGVTPPIRPGRLADAETIAAYHHRCWIEAFSALMEPGVVAAMDPRGKLDRWRRWLADPEFGTSVATDDEDRPIGHVVVRGNELVHLFVDPNHWGHGLGRTLLDVGERKLAAAGHAEIELCTIVGNEPAIALYRSAGWTVTDRLVHNDHDGAVYDEHVLVKRLEQPN